MLASFAPRSERNPTPLLAERRRVSHFLFPLFGAHSLKNETPRKNGILAIYGNQVSGGEFLTGNVREFTSGLDRAIAQADVTNQVEAHQGEYANVEDEIFQIVKAYQEIENKDRFVSEKLAVSYRKPKVLISDAETLANIEKQLKLGLIEEWEKFKIMNPNLSEEECRSKLERINKEKLERQKMFGTEETQTPPEDEDGEDR